MLNYQGYLALKFGINENWEKLDFMTIMTGFEQWKNKFN